MKRCGFLPISFFIINITFAQDSSEVLFVTQLNYNSGYLLSVPGDTTDNNYFPLSLQANALWNFDNNKVWEICNCRPEIGTGLSYSHLARNETGYSLSGYLRLGFLVASGKKVRLRLGGTFGYAYLSKPYQVLDNPLNLSYSLSHGFYESAFLETDILLTKKWWLILGLAHHHWSNGGSKEPNKGVDFPAFLTGVRYEPKEAERDFSERTGFASGKRWRADLYAFATHHAPSRGTKQRYTLGGIHTGAAYRTTGFNGFNTAFELYGDANPASSGFGAGWLAGHEFLFGNIIFFQQFGIYLQDPISSHRFYQRYGLQFRIWKKTGAGISTRFHAQQVDFLDLRIGMSF